jgi:hypothetical protein
MGGVAETATGVRGVATETDFLTIDDSGEILNIVLLDHSKKD